MRDEIRKLRDAFVLLGAMGATELEVGLIYFAFRFITGWDPFHIIP